MVIVAIGGCVIKTAWEEIKELAKRKRFDILIHTGASLFHDFHRAMDKNLKGHSFTLDEMIEDYTRIEKYVKRLMEYFFHNKDAPIGTLTNICHKKKIDIETVITPGCDFWHLFIDGQYWEELGGFNHYTLLRLSNEFVKKQPITFISLGSAVIIPEFFIKVVAFTKRTDIETITVDFLDMYRPRTRLAKYGKYFQMPVKDFLNYWIEYENFNIRNP